MDKAVYLTCGLTSVACAVLLLRSYAGARRRLLLWSGICFSLLAASNLVLYADLVILPDIDLLPLRTALSLAASIVLLFALIFGTG